MSDVLQADLDRPLYLQLVDVLRRDLADKRPGDRIESEPALAERFGVSRFTVSRAVELLVDEGLIRRRQGLGTFVAPPPLRRRPSYLASFTQAAEAQGRAATHRLLSFGKTNWREDYPYDADEKLFRLYRLRLVDNVPTALHASILSADVVRKIGLNDRLANSPGFSLYKSFAQAGLAVARGVETLRARSANVEEGRLLELGDDPVVMEVNRSSFDANGALLDFVHAVYDARRYSYQAEIRSVSVLGAQSADSGETTDAWKTGSQSDFGPRLGPWGDVGLDGGGETDSADHRPGGAGGPIV